MPAMMAIQDAPPLDLEDMISQPVRHRRRGIVGTILIDE
jgi:hypothetical protein